METLNELTKARVWQTLGLLLIVGAVFLGAKTIGEIKGISYIGKNPAMQNTIAVTGKGEEVAIPDIAMVTFDVSEEAASVAAAQESVTKRMNDIIKFLEESGIERKDIKTINYNVYPRYEYDQVRPEIYPPFPEGKRRLAGYAVTHGVEVKIRKTEDAGKILQAIGTKKATNVSGLTFMVEDEEAVKAKARKKAIDDARAKAKRLADDLGVRLVRIVSFNENDYPIYFGKVAAELGRGGDAGGPPTPDIPTGENKVVRNVTIVYEIR